VVREKSLRVWRRLAEGRSRAERRRRQWVEDGLDDRRCRSLVEHGAAEDVLPPGRDKEVSIGDVDGMRPGERRRRLGSPGDGAGDRSAISGKGSQLLTTGVQDLRDPPGLGAAGADLEDECNA
jgi:hypothetical protein